MHLNRKDVGRFKAVDIFAGGGGLSVGLKSAGFDVISAVEIEENAFSTYKTNHPEVRAYRQDIRTVVGKDLLPAEGRIELLAGCPPCQGFCSLTSKYRKEDSRNEMVLEMSRLACEMKPLAIMMENVPGLADKGGLLFEQLLRELDDLGYKVEWRVLQVANYGIPQNRRRFVLLAGYGFGIPFPESTHSRTGKEGKPKWITVKEAIGEMPPAITLQEARAGSGPQAYNWHVVRNMSEKNKERLAHTRPGTSRESLPIRLRPKCHQGSYQGFSNVYGRMVWDQESPTITGGCTTLSKGRFGHPTEDRTISVREAAILQTFPNDYILDTPYIDHACDIVGNALPCDFASVLAKSCADTIRENLSNHTLWQ